MESPRLDRAEISTPYAGKQNVEHGLRHLTGRERSYVAQRLASVVKPKASCQFKRHSAAAACQMRAGAASWTPGLCVDVLSMDGQRIAVKVDEAACVHHLKAAIVDKRVHGAETPELVELYSAGADLQLDDRRRVADLRASGVEGEPMQVFILQHELSPQLPSLQRAAARGSARNGRQGLPNGRHVISQLSDTDVMAAAEKEASVLVRTGFRHKDAAWEYKDALQWLALAHTDMGAARRAAEDAAIRFVTLPRLRCDRPGLVQLAAVIRQLRGLLGHNMQWRYYNPNPRWGTGHAPDCGALLGGRAAPPARARMDADASAAYGPTLGARVYEHVLAALTSAQFQRSRIMATTESVATVRAIAAAFAAIPSAAHSRACAQELASGPRHRFIQQTSTRFLRDMA